MSDDLSWLYRDDRVIALDAVLAETAAKHATSTWQLCPLTSRRLFDVAGDRLKPQSRAALAQRATVAGAVARTARQAALEVSRRLEEHQVAHVFLKAIATQEVIPELRELRAGSDLDLLVPWVEAGAVKTAVEDLGFEEVVSAAQFGAFRRARHFEVATFERVSVVEPESEAAVEAFEREARLAQLPVVRRDRGRYGIVVAVDLHGDLLQELPGEDAVRTRVLPPDGRGVSVPSASWLTLISALKAYVEGCQRYGSGVHLFYEAARMAERLDETEALEAVELFDAYNAAAPAHYVLRRASSFGRKLPAPLQTYVERTRRPSPGRSPHGDNDWGDPWSRLWGSR